MAMLLKAVNTDPKNKAVADYVTKKIIQCVVTQTLRFSKSAESDQPQTTETDISETPNAYNLVRGDQNPTESKKPTIRHLIAILRLQNKLGG